MQQIDPLTTWLFAAVAAGWVVLQFLLHRQAQPSAELDLDVVVGGRLDGQLLIEVRATLANRGLVRHPYRDFRLVVRYLLSGDAIVDGDERVGRQVRFPHSIDERINGIRRTFSNVAYVDPRLTFTHSYVTFVPAETACLLVQCSLRYPRLWRWRYTRKNTQKMFWLKDPTSG